MTLTIPGGQGLFSFLQYGLKHGDKHRIRITPAIQAQLDNFEHLARDLGSCPTLSLEIVPDLLVTLGASDTAKLGMGGVWFPATTHSCLQPILWRASFPWDIQAALVPTANLHGAITNSDLELAGAIAHQDVFVQDVNCGERTTSGLCDNIPAAAWYHKGSTTTTGPTAYLLHLSSLHQPHFRYLACLDYIQGSANAMADDCSRVWQLTDSQLLFYLNARYPKHTA
jgi:hypothetical protein